MYTITIHESVLMHQKFMSVVDLPLRIHMDFDSNWSKVVGLVANKPMERIHRINLADV